MADREKVIKELEILRDICNAKSNMAIGKGKTAWAGYANSADDALSLLREQPEQKHGHWVLDPDGMDWNIPAWLCSVCGCRNDNIPPNLEKTNPRRWSGSRFCPNCGAQMDEEVKQDG